MKEFVVEIFSGYSEVNIAKSVEKYINSLPDNIAGTASNNIQWKTCSVSSSSEYLGCYITAIVSYWK